MPELPKRKIGLVSCSGEEMAEGTVTRLATLQVLETLRSLTSQSRLPHSTTNDSVLSPAQQYRHSEVCFHAQCQRHRL